MTVIHPYGFLITAQKYCLHVQQSGHPGLCKYINHATSEVHRAILSGTFKRISVVIFVQDLPREQFVIDTTQLSQRRLAIAGKQSESEETSLLVNAEQQLRAFLSKPRDHCVSLEALDEQGTFRMVMDTDKDSALGRPVQ